MTPHPRQLTKWATIGSYSAMTETTTSASGTATHLRLVLGKVIVFVASPDTQKNHIMTDCDRDEAMARKIRDAWLGLQTRNPESREAPIPFEIETEYAKQKGEKRDRFFLSAVRGIVDSSLNWEAVVMNPGDDVCVVFCHVVSKNLLTRSAQLYEAWPNVLYFLPKALHSGWGEFLLRGPDRLLHEGSHPGALLWASHRHIANTESITSNAVHKDGGVRSGFDSSGTGARIAQARTT